MSWSRHLKLCKYLKQYNSTVIFFNLLLLFFIVIFPFSISGFAENANENIIIPLMIYLFNVLMVMVVQFLFVNYILKRKTELTISGDDAEKKYFYMQNLYGVIVIAVIFVTLIFVTIISHGNLKAIKYTLDVLPLMALLMRRRLRKYKPIKAK